MRGKNYPNSTGQPFSSSKKIVRLETTSFSGGFRDDLIRGFFGTKSGHKKSYYMISTLTLVTAFFILPAFSVPLDLCVGCAIVCVGLLEPPPAPDIS